MQITAAMVKELRERTGAGMMECKKALQAAGGDIDAAIEQMRKSGAAKADKRAGRVAAEGVVTILLGDDAKTVAMAEVNSETDFVAKGDDFQGFARAIVASVLRNKPADLAALMETSLPEFGDAQFRRMFDLTVVGLDIASQDFQQGRLAAAVASDQADPFARLERQLDAVEQGLIAEAEVEIPGLE